MTDEPMSEAEVRERFSRQGSNANLGATLTYIAPGEIHVGVTHLALDSGHREAQLDTLQTITWWSSMSS